MKFKKVNNNNNINSNINNNNNNCKNKWFYPNYNKLMKKNCFYHRD